MTRDFLYAENADSFDQRAVTSSTRRGVSILLHTSPPSSVFLQTVLVLGAGGVLEDVDALAIAYATERHFGDALNDGQTERMIILGKMPQSLTQGPYTFYYSKGHNHC